jgi:hypothetical protein
MNDKFILLTTTEDKSVIIGISNISSIETNDEKGNNGTVITLNFARNRDLWPKAFEVKESFDEIKNMLGL